MSGYKIGNMPGARAYKEELADFWEVQSIRNPNTFVSSIQISKAISMELDELQHNGLLSEDDILNEGNESYGGLDDVFIELQRRVEFSNQRYPFTFSKYSLQFNEETGLLKNVYLFLLLCTRLNMTKQKIFNDIDGTHLFEHLCAHVAKNFFGLSAQSFVFGTAQSGGFEEKVSDLIKQVGIGEAFSNPNYNAPTKKDDSIDIVVWKEFSDKREGKLIGFGQCKTGTTSWRDDIRQLNPSNFCKSWFNRHPVIDPIPLVFICDTMNEDRNFYTDQQGYLVFNRFRIIEYVDESLDESIKADISSWLEGATQTLEIRN